MKNSSRFDQLSSLQRRSNDALSGPAQSPALLTPNSVEDSFLQTLQSFITNNKAYPNQFKLMAWFMYCSGARVSEVLRVRACDVNGRYRVLIRASKGSQNRVCLISPLAGIELDMMGGGQNLLFQYSRFYVYRVFRNLGLSIRKEGNVNSSVTHSARNIYASEVRALTGVTDDMSNALGHKSKKSKLYYAKKIIK